MEDKTCRAESAITDPLLSRTTMRKNDLQIALLQDLTAEFPDSDWISATAALAQYNLRNFDEAQELYEDLLERDPHRIDVSRRSFRDAMNDPHRGAVWGSCSLRRDFPQRTLSSSSPCPCPLLSVHGNENLHVCNGAAPLMHPGSCSCALLQAPLATLKLGGLELAQQGIVHARWSVGPSCVRSMPVSHHRAACLYPRRWLQKLELNLR